MSKAEAFEVNFGDNKSIGVNVNFTKGDAIKVPVSINSLDAEKVGKEVGDRIAEKLDETALASVAKESTLLLESQRIKDEVRNIDFSSVEAKVDEVKQAVENIDLSPIESKVEAGVETLSSKIDNIDLSVVAKQGENQEATNSAIYALLKQFGESVLQEDVTIICNCAEDIAWEEYGIVITYADGTSQSLPMSENGTCSFSVKIGQEYSVQLPVIGAYIAPTLKTYIASTSSRQIYWSYAVSGVFGLDELGRRYTIEQIEALSNKSIIIAGGYTDEELENSIRDDGTTGNGFMWDINQELLTAQWASKLVEFSQDLLPFATTDAAAIKLCNGEAYTRYMIAEAARLFITSPAATLCQGRTLTVNSIIKKGFLPAAGQIIKLALNITSFNALYTALGLTAPTINSSQWWTSCQGGALYAAYLIKTNISYSGAKNAHYNVLCCFDL